MSGSNITIKVYNGPNRLVAEYRVTDHLVNNDDIRVQEIVYNPDGSVFNQSNASGWNLDFLVDNYMSTSPNVVGEHTTIHIERLTPDDAEFFNRLFANAYQIPDCTSFTVAPSVGLTHLPVVASDKNDDVCPICLDNLYDKPASYISGNTAGTRYCNHKFHTDCIRQYCGQQNGDCKCPICRNKINIDDIRPLAGGRRRRKRRTKKRAIKSKRARKRKQRQTAKRR